MESRVVQGESEHAHKRLGLEGLKAKKSIPERAQQNKEEEEGMPVVCLPFAGQLLVKGKETLTRRKGVREEKNPWGTWKAT